MIEFSIALSLLMLITSGFAIFLPLLSYHNGIRAGLFQAARKGMITVGEANREVEILNTMNRYFSLRSLFKSGDYVLTYTAYNSLDDKIANTNGRPADLGNAAEIVTYSVDANFNNTFDNVFLPRIQTSQQITIFNEDN